MVPKREGQAVRELPITSGWNVLDSNILACSQVHFAKVCAMLSGQSQRAEFTGGLEAARLTDWHVGKLWALRPSQMFFAYDTPDDLEPLRAAGKMLRYADFTRGHLRAYVLIGWPKDTFDKAQSRLLQAWDAGFLPMAMLWRGKNSPEPSKEWKAFQRGWARPPAVKAQVRDCFLSGLGGELL